jgi:RNA polymerase primary sigma factor
MTMKSNLVLEFALQDGASTRKPAAKTGMHGDGVSSSPRNRGRGHSQRSSKVARACQDEPADSPRGQRVLSADEEHELAERIKRGDKAARKHLIMANLRLVVSIVRKYRSGRLSFDDLIQEGNLGLIRASQDFDPSVREARFSTYAEIWIKAFVHRALIANDSLIRVPENVFLLRKRYRRAIDALRGQYRIDDAEAERTGVDQLAREIGVSPRQLKPSKLARIACGPEGGTDEDGRSVAIGDTIVDHRRPDEEAANHEERMLLEAALHRLNPVEAWVIRERFGLSQLIPCDDVSTPNPRAETDRVPAPQLNPQGDRQSYFHRTYPELERDCGLSRHRIHQVERMALNKLRDVLGPWLAQAM